MSKSVLSGLVFSALASIFIVGCGQQEYAKQETVNGNLGAQSRYLPGKVDILLVPDNSPSINLIMASTLSSQLTSFATSLRSKYWDYHVAKIDMLSPSPISKVLVNPDYNSATLPDGSPNASPIVPAGAAVTNPASFPMNIPAVTGGLGDPTYSNVLNQLYAAENDTSVNFLRPDAILAVVILTNGMERLQSNRYETTLSYSEAAALSNYAAQLIALKGSKHMIQFYAIAANSYYDGSAMHSCLAQGGTAESGVSYTAMVNNGYLNGLTLNFCDSSALSNVMNAIDENLTKIRQDYIYSYLVLDKAPRVDTIRVVKANGQEVSQGTVNGWEYVGYGTQYTITGVVDDNGIRSNLLLNQRTGYLIKLNGTAEMLGSDSPQVYYTPQ